MLGSKNGWRIVDAAYHAKDGKVLVSWEQYTGKEEEEDEGVVESALREK
jgi:hypothetical protein